jgi:hypothetical protein
MGDAFDQPASDSSETKRERSVPVRRRWHAPQFMLTEIALSDAQSATPSDHNNGQGPVTS